MSRTYSQVIERARRILQDEDSGNYRYTAASLSDSINDALLEVRRVRPDLFLAASFVTTDVDETVDGNTVLPIEDMNFQSLVYMVCGYAMLRDDTYSQDSRAVNLLNKGTAQLLTVNS